MRIPYLDFVPSVAAPIDCAPTAAIVGRTVAGPGLVMRGYATLRADGEWVRVGANALLRRARHRAHRRRHAVRQHRRRRHRRPLRARARLHGRRSRGRGRRGARDGRRARRRRVADHRGQSRAAAQEAGRRLDLRRLSGNAGARNRRGRARRSGGRDPPAHSLGARHGDRAASARRWRRTRARARSTRRSPRSLARRSANAYVAPTALVAGDVELADDASVYFGCAVVAGDGRIVDRTAHERAGQFAARHRCGARAAHRSAPTSRSDTTSGWARRRSATMR